MRSKIAAVAVGFGVFMIVAAVLVRAYAYPTLATVPASYKGTTMLEATGAEVLNFETYQPETHDLRIESFTIADSGADTPDGVVVWLNSATVTREDGSIFQQTRERAAFDAVSGAGVDCEECESWTEAKDGDEVVQEPTVREGQVYKFPFGTEKRDYDVWDGTIGESSKATFEGVEEIDGLSVYKFVQKIDARVVESREVPGSMFGSTEASVDAELWYGMNRTFWVEPQTGSPVDRVEERTQELRYDGIAVPVFNGTVQYTDQQVSDLINGTKDMKGAKENGMMLGGAKLLYPLVMGLVGLVLLAAGLFLGRSARSHKRDEAEPRKDLVKA
ncbi:hypothetical protein ASE01_12695 [Nocardioides sp. Root190]|uniref:DUF3068 domain-containing protein n=1 Tax=Nocardioides sp. Root190 TaxID=1736488 RepID=UPI0006FE6E2B|nr:DUF3068 domain-containing protein [Nocardioides sp. Root190]KRB75906.1 hypothetical protein ASE01_12695 [Nocardioides sp. Root190]